jgi:hypothetical protein
MLCPLHACMALHGIIPVVLLGPGHSVLIISILDAGRKVSLVWGKAWKSGNRYVVHCGLRASTTWVPRAPLLLIFQAQLNIESLDNPSLCRNPVPPAFTMRIIFLKLDACLFLEGAI